MCLNINIIFIRTSLSTYNSLLELFELFKEVALCLFLLLLKLE